MVGGFLGVVVAFMVICSLAEISLSFFEAIMFGIVLLFVGCFMIWSVPALCAPDLCICACIFNWC